MNEHFQFLILPEVNVHVFISSPCISVGQVMYLENNGLFVQLGHLGLTRIDHPVDAGRKNIITVSLDAFSSIFTELISKPPLSY